MAEILVLLAQGFAGLIVLWVAVRVAAVAFFKSKQEVEGVSHGSKQNP